MSQSTLTAEDYRVMRYCYERDGKVKPAELTVKWRTYHDNRGAARAKLNYLVNAGIGHWKGTPEHPQADYFFLNKAWMDHFDKEKSDKFKIKIWGIVAGIVVCGVVIALAVVFNKAEATTSGPP
jgi:hypothetical protein